MRRGGGPGVSDGRQGFEDDGNDAVDDGSGDGPDDGRRSTRPPVVMPEVDDGLDEESYQRLHGQRLRRLWRQRIVFGVVVLLVLLVGGGAALIWTGRWDPGASRETPAASAPSSTCTPAPEQPLLAPAEVTVEVLNGTDRRGLAASVAAELRTRGFVVSRVDNAPAPAGPVTVSVRYPTFAEQHARTVAARFADAQMVPDDTATIVQVSLGDGYQALFAEDALVPPAQALPADC